MRRTKLRSPSMYKKYTESEYDPDFFFKRDKKIDFNGGFIVENDFPYDKVAEVHDLFVPEYEGVYSEFIELEKEIPDFIKSNYDSLLWNLPKSQSVPKHPHIHLIKWKTI